MLSNVDTAVIIEFLIASKSQMDLQRNKIYNNIVTACVNVKKVQRTMKRDYDSKQNKKSRMELKIGEKLLVEYRERKKMPGTNPEEP